MKLGLTRDTQSLLDKALADLAALVTAIGELGRHREVALASDADVDAIAAIDREAHDQGRRLRALQDKISLLEGRLAVEQQEQDDKRYDQAVAKFEHALPARHKAALAIEQTIADLIAALRWYRDANEAVTKSWPDDVPWPNVYAPGYLGVSRLGELIANSVGADLVGHFGHRAPAASEWFDRLCKLSAAGFADGEREQHRALIDDLRAAHSPPAQTNQEEAA